MENFDKNVVNDVVGAGKDVVGFLGDPNNQKVFRDMLGLDAGIALMLLGVGGEVGGVALDVTGVGAVGGIPLNIASAGAITAGSAGAIYEAGQLGKDIPNMHFATTDSGGPSGGPNPSPNFVEPTNPPQYPPNESDLPPGYSVRPMGPTEQYPNGYWVETNAQGNLWTRPRVSHHLT